MSEKLDRFTHRRVVNLAAENWDRIATDWKGLRRLPPREFEIARRRVIEAIFYALHQELEKDGDCDPDNVLLRAMGIAKAFLEKKGRK